MFPTPERTSVSGIRSEVIDLAALEKRNHAIIDRVKGIFEGIDLSQDGVSQVGQITITVDEDMDYPGSRRAIATFNNIELAGMIDFSSSSVSRNEGYEFYPGEPKPQGEYWINARYDDSQDDHPGTLRDITFEVTDYGTYTSMKPIPYDKNVSMVSEKKILESMGIRV